MKGSASQNGPDTALQKRFPEVGAGGFTSIDGTVEFYSRVQALLRSDMHVLDFGAGRGASLSDDPVSYRRNLRTLKGKVARVVACDVDNAVLGNPAADEICVISRECPLPFNDSTFDMIVCDFVFEHIEKPESVCRELARVTKTGGWICARTPNKWSIPAIGARIIRNSAHKKVLRVLQPKRKEMDVFPTAFRLNSFRSVRSHFPASSFEHFCYRYEPEPGYFFGNSFGLATVLIVNALSPSFMKTNLFLFLRKR